LNQEVPTLSLMEIQTAVDALHLIARQSVQRACLSVQLHETMFVVTLAYKTEAGKKESTQESIEIIG